MSEDKLDFGDVVWYVEPQTGDIVYAVDGEDNNNYFL